MKNKGNERWLRLGLGCVILLVAEIRRSWGWHD